jgi:CubicO group peptidase (beta-lactamase class C family)
VGIHDKVLFLQAFGRVDSVAEADPVCVDTIFDLASLTKPLATALAICLLVQDGRLEWDTPLSHIFGMNINSPLLTAEASISHLLAHCSGLPAFRPYYYFLRKEPQPHPKTWVRRRILDEPLQYKPGQSALYSDLDFMLLESVVEITSGEPLDSFVRDRIYEPSHLERTGFWTGNPTKFLPQEFACTGTCPIRKRSLRGEVHDRNAYVLGGMSGHAGLFSSAEDLYRLLVELLHAYLGEGETLFLSKEVRRMFARKGLPRNSTWALGFDTPSPQNSSAGTLFSSRSIGHLGFTGVSFWMELDTGIIAVLLTNRTAFRPHTAAIRRFRPQLYTLAYQAAQLEIELYGRN